MRREFFELEDDVDMEGRWHLNGLYDAMGTQLDSRYFCRGLRMDHISSTKVPLWSDGSMVDAKHPLNVALRSTGIPLDFTYADFDMPITRRSVSDILVAIDTANVQRLPVVVADGTKGFDIINVASLIDCIDIERSDIDWWEAGNDIRPDLAGTPRLVSELVIDPGRVVDQHIFRPLGWAMRIIVSDVVKSAFLNAHVTGVRFRKVSA